MEVWQRKWIRTHICDLISFSNINEAVTTYLAAKDVLSQMDIDMLQGSRNKSADMSQLVAILTSRHGGYDALLQAFLETKQSWAARILQEGKKSNKDDGEIYKADLKTAHAQRDWVSRNLVELFQATKVDSDLLLLLQGKSIIGDFDREHLQSLQTDIERVDAFFKIICTRVGGYDATIDALVATNRKTAADILIKGNDELKNKEANPKNELGKEDEEERAKTAKVYTNILRENMSSLIEYTRANSMLVASLRTKCVLGDHDVDQLMASREGTERTMKLYQILKFRVYSYYDVLESLVLTKQTRAARILEHGKRKLLKNEGPSEKVEMDDEKEKLEECLIKCVQENLWDLTRCIIVTETLLASLQGSGVLGRADVDELQISGEELARSKLLYDILKTRIGGYEALVTALMAENQMEAADIPHKGIL